MSKNVLIIEDDPDIAQLIAMHLRDNECETELADTGKAGLEAFFSGQFDLVVLDVMLPEMDGLAVCRELRSQTDYVPILMLTSKSSELDRVLGLEMGADDYLTKPFSIPELIARVRALFRRVEALDKKSRNSNGAKLIEHTGMKIDMERHEVRIDDNKVELTAREFELLVHFASHPGHVFNRTQLLDQVWGYNHEGYEHTVNTHINRLRAKIESDPAKPRFIQTVWGVGYKFAE